MIRIARCRAIIRPYDQYHSPCVGDSQPDAGGLHHSNDRSHPEEPARDQHGGQGGLGDQYEVAEPPELWLDDLVEDPRRAGEDWVLDPGVDVAAQT